MRKQPAPVKVCCKDCRNERPVTHEFPAFDGSAVFCLCDYLEHYRQRRWPQPCAHFVAKDDTAENQRENK